MRSHHSHLQLSLVRYLAVRRGDCAVLLQEAAQHLRLSSGVGMRRSDQDRRRCAAVQRLPPTTQRGHLSARASGEQIAE